MAVELATVELCWRVGTAQAETRQLGTGPGDLRSLCRWGSAEGVSDAAMEVTDVFC